MKVDFFLASLLCLGLLGCEGRNQSQFGHSGDYEILKPTYLGSYTIEGIATESPHLCSGVAGEVMNFGCHVSLVSIRMYDGTKLLALVDSRRKITPETRLYGHIVFVSTDITWRAREYMP